MITKEIFQFLEDLRANNEREWFHSNKRKYEAALKSFKKVVSDWHQGIAFLDEHIAENDPQKAVFRIYRDVRFSANKAPYKDNFGAALGRGGRTSSWAGYYLHISPGASFFAGGKWMPENAEIKKIRQEIDYNYQQLNAILEEERFKKVFGDLDKEHSLKTSPRDYSAEHPAIELLKLKSFVVTAPLSDELIQSPAFISTLVEYSTLMHPFLNFLNTALEE